ncbi:hypothetical protein BH11ARM1_BH11ARM1_06360 [soil metagenome]
MPVGYDDFVQIALELPEVGVALYFGSLCVKRNGRAMFCPKGEDEMAIKLDWPTHDRLLSTRPDVFYKTDHYYKWPWLLVRLDRLNLDEVSGLVRASWTDAPKPARLLRSI